MDDVIQKRISIFVSHPVIIPLCCGCVKTCVCVYVYVYMCICVYMCRCVYEYVCVDVDVDVDQFDPDCTVFFFNLVFLFSHLVGQKTTDKTH